MTTDVCHSETNMHIQTPTIISQYQMTRYISCTSSYHTHRADTTGSLLRQMAIKILRSTCHVSKLLVL